MSNIILGLTGENCSGKTTAAEYMKKKGFYYLSLSDVIREEVIKEGKPLTRENLVKKGNEMRKRFGDGILAKKTIEKMEEGKNYIVDSIRNPGEVEELKKLQNFYLIYINAPAEVRFERIKARGREEDPQTFEEFLKLEKMEEENKEGYKQQLKKTAGMADFTILNDSSIERFYESIDGVLERVIKRFEFKRPVWDEYFMNIAKVVSSRANCIKRKIGAVIVKDKRVISTGYNGTPRGVKNCYEGGCPRCNAFTESGKNLESCFCAHAEENAIVQAAYHGVSVKGGTLYTTYSPCLYCARMIINAGIVEVVYNEQYPLAEDAIRLLKEAGVKVRAMKV